mgnify:CR=1 FL=1
MNEEKNGIEAYVRLFSISKLTYAIVHNLIHGKKIEIYILRELYKELSCYEEIKFWLNKGLIKVWKK